MGIAIPWELLPDGPDVMLNNLSNTPALHELLNWAGSTPGLHQFPTEFHRLQLEHWLWQQRDDLVGKRVLDVGVEIRRDWIGADYHTFNEPGRDGDLCGDLQALLVPSDYLDAIICTEVLEHVPDPAQAVREIHRVLAPGGIMLASSPFLWPDHRCDGYPDYWRFTQQGWARLCTPFAEVSIQGTQWTDEATGALDLARRFEAWCWRDPERMPSGYLVRATK